MTVYIAGKMTGEEKYNFERFNAKADELAAKGWRVLNPAKIGLLPEYKMYWPINKAMLDGADAIYMLDGWEDSPGARRELYYAIDKGTPILFESAASIGRMLDQRMHSMSVAALPDCNTCGAYRRCQHVPQLGQHVRINCHMWEARP